MKRLLLGTSALVTAGVLISGPAASQAAGLEASVNGFMEQWFGYRSLNGTGTNQLTDFKHTSDTEVIFQAEATLDNGLTVTYNVQLEGNTDQGGDQIDESFIRLTSSFGQFLMGSENSAQYLMGFVPQNFGIGAISGDNSAWANQRILGPGPGEFRSPWGSGNIETDVSCNDDKRLTYFTPRLSGFQFGVSYTPRCGNQDQNGLSTTRGSVHDVFNIGANYIGRFDDVGIRVSGGFGYGEKPDGDPGSNPSTINFGTNISFGGFSLGGYYADTLSATHPQAGLIHNNNTGYSVGLAYETGPWGASLIWRHGERDGLAANTNQDEVDVIQLGAQYTLGPGVALRGTVGYTEIDDETPRVNQDGFYVVGGIKVSF
jgi:predicted porin